MDEGLSNKMGEYANSRLGSSGSFSDLRRAKIRLEEIKAEHTGSIYRWPYNLGYRSHIKRGAAVAEWLNSWLAEQENGVRFPASPLEFSEIGYLLLPSRDMAEIPLKAT